MASKPNPQDVKADREARSAEAANEKLDRNKPAIEARKEAAEAREKLDREAREKEMERVAEEDKKEKEQGNVLLHSPEKAGAGSGLKPGDWHAPASNPGAAARVPSQPLQPESMQTHGEGIIFDKDLTNPPYDEGDPVETDAAPSGSGSPSNLGAAAAEKFDKKAEVEKQEKASGRSRAIDPDNPSGDPTGSPKPIGSHRMGQDVPGGSNSGVTDREKR